MLGSEAGYERLGTVTRISGSSPGMYRRLGSNPERALCRYISLVVTVRGYGIEALEPEQNIRQLSS